MLVLQFLYLQEPYAGGGALSAFDDLRSIDYIDITSTGNASDFGDLNEPVSNGVLQHQLVEVYYRWIRMECRINGNQVSYVTISSLEFTRF